MQIELRSPVELAISHRSLQLFPIFPHPPSWWNIFSTRNSSGVLWKLINQAIEAYGENTFTIQPCLLGQPCTNLVARGKCSLRWLAPSKRSGGAWGKFASHWVIGWLWMIFLKKYPNGFFLQTCMLVGYLFIRFSQPNYKRLANWKWEATSSWLLKLTGNEEWMGKNHQGVCPILGGFWEKSEKVGTCRG